MAAGIEVWTWVIAEKPVAEVVLISEILAAWFATVRDRKGVFSQSLKSGILTRSCHNSCHNSFSQLRRSVLPSSRVQSHRQGGNRSRVFQCSTSSFATYPCFANAVQPITSCSLSSISGYISYATACLTVHPRPQAGQVGYIPKCIG